MIREQEGEGNGRYGENGKRADVANGITQRNRATEGSTGRHALLRDARRTRWREGVRNFVCEA
jgi:hypothetical protein